MKRHLPLIAFLFLSFGAFGAGAPYVVNYGINGTNLFLAGISNGANFTSPVQSWTNATFGVDPQGNNGLTPGGGIMFPDKGGIGWKDGAAIFNLNDAHNSAGTGDATVIEARHGLVISLNVSTTNESGIIQIGLTGPVSQDTYMQFNDFFNTGSFPSGYGNTRSKIFGFVDQSGYSYLQGVGVDTNFNSFSELWFYSGHPLTIGQPVISGSQLGTGPFKRMGRMKTNGWEFSGEVVYQAATNLQSAVLDFSKGGLSDIYATNINLTFSTANRVGTPGIYERAVFYVHANGATINFTYPAWATNINTAMPASITNGNFLRLELESVGPGETNVVVALATVQRDQSWSVDPDAQSFFTRAAITSPLSIGAVNQLVKDAKSNGWWNFFTNGVIYTLLGGETNNLINNTIGGYVPQGTFTTNGSGFTGDGVNGCANTRLSPNAAGFTATNIGYFAYADTNGAVTTTSPIGNEGVDTFGRVLVTISGGVVWSGRGPQAALGTTIPDADFGVGANKNVYLVRTNAANISLFSGSISQTAASVNAATVEHSMAFFGASNNGNPVPVLFYKGTIKFVAIGTGITSATLIQQMFADVTKFETYLGRQ